MARLLCRPFAFVYDPVGELAELSNFYPCEFVHKEQLWRSVEHFYQAAKFSSPDDQDRVRSCASGADARNLAWGELHEKVRPDWDEIRVDVMRVALRRKFATCQVSRRKLMSTWPFPLAEDSSHDSFWGLGPDGSGANTLGVELEAIRCELLDLPPLNFDVSGLKEIGKNLESRIEAAACLSYNVAPLWIPFDPSALASTQLSNTIIDDVMVSQLRDTCDSSGSGSSSLQISPERNRAVFNHRRVAWASVPMALMAESMDVLNRLRGFAFDKKYGRYLWSEDARCAVIDWRDQFVDWLSRQLPAHTNSVRGIVIGAGAGEETRMVWSQFPGRLLLTDIGQGLIDNCRRQHPHAETLCTSAEELDGVSDTSFDFYCALRTYQSIHFDSDLAIAQAHRVLRPGGLIVISVSDAYLRADGRIQRGQIVGDKIDLSAGLTQLCELADILASSGFRSVGFHSFETELIVFASRPE